MAPKVKRPTTAMGKCTPIPSAKAAASNETNSNETKNKKQNTRDELDVKIEYEKVMHKSSVLTSTTQPIRLIISIPTRIKIIV
jgi:hypothetical protein